MQFKNFLFLLILCFSFLGFSQNLEAQRIAQNRHGEQIVVFANGKWEYYDESKPLHRAILKESENAKNAEYTAKGSSDSVIENGLYLISLAEEELALAQEKEQNAKFSKILLEEELEEIKEDDSATEDEYLVVKRQLKIASALEKEAKKRTKKAKRKLKKAKKKGNKNPKNQTKIAKSKTRKKAKKEHLKTLEAQNTSFAYQEDQSFYSASKKFKKYNIEDDVMYHPPHTECNLAFDGIDEFMGKRRRDVERQVFFTHTDEDMRRYMANDEYIICEGSMTQIKGGVLLFNLFISINTTDAKRAFGELNKGGLITIKMIDGSKVTLANNRTDTGVFDALTKRHNFTGQYMVNSGQEKILKNGEVDVVRIIWDTGYEDYEVYNLDFFKDQFRCLDK